MIEIKLRNRRVALQKGPGEYVIVFKRLQLKREENAKPVMAYRHGRVTITKIKLSDQAMKALVYAFHKLNNDIK